LRKYESRLKGGPPRAASFPYAGYLRQPRGEGEGEVTYTQFKEEPEPMRSFIMQLEPS
jgi:hypothetical protein